MLHQRLENGLVKKLFDSKQRTTNIVLAIVGPKVLNSTVVIPIGIFNSAEGWEPIILTGFIEALLPR